MSLFSSHSPAHKYYLTTDPMSGAVFLSDTNSRRVFKIKSTVVVKDLVKNSEVVAGTGDQCLPFDDTRCGDGGKATEATLTNPRGKALLLSTISSICWGCFPFPKVLRVYHCKKSWKLPRNDDPGNVQSTMHLSS
jgi:hypothetical protein